MQRDIVVGVVYSAQHSYNSFGIPLIGKLFGLGNKASKEKNPGTSKSGTSKDGNASSSSKGPHRSRRSGGGQGKSHRSQNQSKSNQNKPHRNRQNNNRKHDNKQVNPNQHKVSTDEASNTNSKPAATQTPWDINQFQVPQLEGKTRFHDLDLPNNVMHAIADLGFEYCTPIQAKALPFSLNGQDVVGKAQTGTGKTAAFLLAIIEDLIKHPLEQQRYAGEARALIMAPTRELVMQIAEDAKALTKYTDLQVHTLVGGMDYGKQQQKLQDSLVDILVATPGRLIDFCGNKDVFLDQVEVLVIDEADRMLDMGFIPQLRRIVRQTPNKSHRQTLLFSATFSEDVTYLVEQWTVDRVTVEIEPETVATASVDQRVYLAAASEKYALLYNILKKENVESLIAFANRRDEARGLWEHLKAHGFKAGLLSGEIQQKQRVNTLDKFKQGQLQVLVATDVAGRGIHIDGISHVVNLTLPEEPEDYVHRIGRTGRAGKRGTSISFACEDDAFRLMPIQQLLGEDLKCEQPPEHLLEAPPHVDIPSPKQRGHRRNGQRRSR